MSMKEFTIPTNTGYVEMATGDMSLGQIDNIADRAQAQVQTVKEDAARVESAEKGTAVSSPQGNAEANVYGSLAMEALLPGAKMASTVAEFFDARRSDAAQGFTPSPQRGKTDGITHGNARTVEQDIAGAMRSPGLYREPAKPSVYGAGASTSSTGKKKKSEGESIVMSANIAQDSLRGQPKALFSKMDVPSGKMASVSEAKKLTFGHALSNEQALASAMRARQEHSATIHHVNQLSPGLGMASGPTIRPEQLLREARDNSDERWRSGNV